MKFGGKCVLRGFKIVPFILMGNITMYHQKSLDWFQDMGMNDKYQDLFYIKIT